MPEPLPARETPLLPLIERFYARVRNDPGLGPVFEAAISDWPAHHRLLADFWSSVVFTSGRYKGNPVAVHMLHAGSLSPALFRRWLLLWTATTDELLPPAHAAAMQAKAARIAESLQLAILHRHPSTNTHSPQGDES